MGQRMRGKLLEIESEFPIRFATPMIVRVVAGRVNRCEQIFLGCRFLFSASLECTFTAW
jgi:hypothetical protein